MKKLLFIITILIFTSCKDKKKDPVPPVYNDSIRCDMGIDSMEFENNLRSASKKRRDPVPPPPTPKPVLNAAVFLLDFDGHIVENTSWNYQGPIVCEDSGLDSLQMLEIIAKFQEAYSPWVVSVTTSEDDYNKAASKQRIVFTRTWEFFGRAGGGSFIGSIKFPGGSPAFVFTALLNYSTKAIKEAGVHEMGHCLGLLHQSYYENGVKIYEYDYGANGIAPIMGYGANQPVTVFRKGLNAFGVLIDEPAFIGTVLKVK